MWPVARGCLLTFLSLFCLVKIYIYILLCLKISDIQKSTGSSSDTLIQLARASRWAHGPSLRAVSRRRKNGCLTFPIQLWSVLVAGNIWDTHSFFQKKMSFYNGTWGYCQLWDGVQPFEMNPRHGVSMFWTWVNDGGCDKPHPKSVWQSSGTKQLPWKSEQEKIQKHHVILLQFY